MLREGGASSNPRCRWLLDRPPSRTMTIVGTRHLPLVSLCTSAAFARPVHAGGGGGAIVYPMSRPATIAPSQSAIGKIAAIFALEVTTSAPGATAAGAGRPSAPSNVRVRIQTEKPARTIRNILIRKAGVAN